MRNWQGIIAVPNTPFTAEGAVDVAGLERLCAYLAASGAPAALVLGVVAETHLLTAEERETVARVMTQGAAGRFDAILAIGGDGPEALARAAADAARQGAAAVNWRPPAGMETGAVVAALRAIADASGLAIMLQDFDLTGGGIADATLLAAVAEVPAVAAMKIEVAESLPKIARIRAAAARPLTLCAGWPIHALIRALANGADAVMPTSLTPLLCHFARQVAAGDAAAAERDFARLLPLFAVMTQGLGPSIRINKEMRRIEGVFETARCRVPEAAGFVPGEGVLAMVRDAVALQAERTGWRAP